MNDMTKYYKEFYKIHGEDAYQMGTMPMTGRIRTLQVWSDKHTPKNGALLDIGCGDAYLKTLIRPDIQYKGIDLNVSQALGQIEHDLSSAPYPLESRSFDTLVCSEVLEHLWDPRIVHKEAARVIKRGGVYIVSTPNFDWIDHHLTEFRHLLWNHQAPHLFEHIRQYNQETHTQYLNAAGFRVEEVQGADAQYSRVLNPALNMLTQILEKEKGLQLESGEVDAIIGKLVPNLSHTIMLRCRAI